jgi:hypothetical protein
VIVIPSAWLAVLLFALTMCRLAARSDDSQAVALAERLAASNLASHEDVSADVRAARRLRRLAG